MSAIEQELFDKIRNLDEAHQKQLLQIVDNMQPKPFDFDEWMREVEALHEQLKADGQLVRVEDLLDELRR
jgi:hypothetical protein